jgi:hypothetical protein
MRTSPIFVRTYDMLLWLIPRTLAFPRSQRMVLARTVQEAALRFQERIIEAGLGYEPANRLRQADVELEKLRLHLRLCHDLKLLSMGQYEHVSRLVAEIGRLLGGWQKKEKSTEAL